MTDKVSLALSLHHLSWIASLFFLCYYFCQFATHWLHPLHVTRWIHNSVSQIWDKLNSIIKWLLEVDCLKMINWSLILFYHFQCLYNLIWSRIISRWNPLCNSRIHPATKNHKTIFLGWGIVQQFSGLLPIRNPSLMKILKTATLQNIKLVNFMIE